MSIKTLAVAACAGLFMLGGCATYYRAQTATVATLNLVPGISVWHLGAGEMQEISIATDNRCSSVGEAHRFGPLKMSPKSLPIDANRRLIFQALARSYTVGSHGICINRLAFTPRAGESYRMVQHTQFHNACSFEVIALSTGRPPEDLEILKEEPCERDR